MSEDSFAACLCTGYRRISCSKVCALRQLGQIELPAKWNVAHSEQKIWPQVVDMVILFSSVSRQIAQTNVNIARSSLDGMYERIDARGRNVYSVVQLFAFASRTVSTCASARDLPAVEHARGVVTIDGSLGTMHVELQWLV